MADLPYGTEVLLVIVGAGASFDAFPGAPNVNVGVIANGGSYSFSDVRPPLTKDLAQPNLYRNELALRYRPVTPLLDHLREALRPGVETVSLEQALRGYLDLAADDDSLRRHVTAARFYLRDLLTTATEAVHNLTGGTTNYTTLVRRCYRWAIDNPGHVCFVSFNYDTLLDLACEAQWGLNLSDPNDFVAHPRASLVKPHGSSQWAWRLAEGGYPDSVTAAHATISRGEPRDLAHRPIFARQAGLSPGHYGLELPALALPVEAKSEFVWPPSHLQHLRGLDTKVRRLLAVGWRAAESNFTELLPPLVKARARVLSVQGGGNAEQDANDMLNNLGSIIEYVEPKWTSGFTAALQDGSIDWVLERVAWPGP